MNAEGDDLKGVVNAVDFIANLRQAEDMAEVPVGRDLVVIGGGMAAIDAVVQAELLGAPNVTLVYRRARERMNARVFEQYLAASKGVWIVTHAVLKEITGNGSVAGIEFEYVDAEMQPTGALLQLPADQVLRAIGQRLVGGRLPALEGCKIKVAGAGLISIEGVWAVGDCPAGGEDLTVTAVAEGHDAATDMHETLSV